MSLIDGFAPGAEGFQGHAGNHQQLREWLLALGCEPARVEGMRPANLFKAYRYPEYLRCMTQRRDYFPNGLQEVPQCPPSTNIIATVAAVQPSPIPTLKAAIPATIARGALKKSAAVSTPQPGPIAPICANGTTTSSSPVPDKVETLANMLRDFAGAGVSNGLTEARVIELIREHAPQIIRECLS